MIDSYFRTPYQTLLVDPLLPLLKRINIPPLVYTWLALCTGISIVPALYFGHSYVAFCLLLASGFLDTVDGSVARAKNAATPKGAVLDIIADRTVETSIIIGLYLVDPTTRGLYCLLMLGSAFLCVTSFLVVGIFMHNEGYKSFYYSPGMMERSEAFFFFAMMILLPSLFPYVSLLFSVLVMMTALVRVRQFCGAM